MAPEVPFSIQLHSAQQVLPIARHLPRLAALGYTNVETSDQHYDDPSALKAALDANGLTALSGHFSLARFEADIDAVCRIAETLGMRFVVCPFVPDDVRPHQTDDWRRLGDRLAGIAAAVETRGFGFAWHNHDYEFRPLPDGSLPIQHLAADAAVHLEIDVAWVALAGVDPQPWIEGYAGRIDAIHVKDIAPRGSLIDEDGWADVGTGVIPWPKLWRTAAKAGVAVMIAEHDKPADFDRFARRSIDSMRAYEAMIAGDPPVPVQPGV